jgi:hypothetical protein
MPPSIVAATGCAWPAIWPTPLSSSPIRPEYYFNGSLAFTVRIMVACTLATGCSPSGWNLLMSVAKPATSSGT